MDEKKGTITLRAEKAADELKSEFHAMYTKEDFAYKLKCLRNSHQSDRSDIVKQLCVMFRSCGIECSYGKEYKYYEALANELDIPDDVGVLEDRLVLRLFDMYTEFPSPEDYMNRITDSLRGDDDACKNGTLRLKILKIFIKYGEYLTKAGYRGKVYIYERFRSDTQKEPSENDILDWIDDSIFEALSLKAPEVTVTKDKEKKQRESQKNFEKKFSLLKTADALASGKFRNGGAAQKDLYLFAMVCGMTFDPENPDSRTDIEKNLFTDYYQNNLMRFISEDSDGYEEDPSGRGINYKSFEDVIYLYYITRNDLLPAEKIERSCEMISRVKKSLSSKSSPPSDEPEQTRHFRNIIRSEREYLGKNIFCLDEAGFEDFVVNNYISSTSEAQKQNSAFRQYKAVIKKLDGYTDDVWTPKGNPFRKNLQKIVKRHPELDGKKFNDFIALITKTIKFLSDNSSLTINRPEKCGL